MNLLLCLGRALLACLSLSLTLAALGCQEAADVLPPAPRALDAELLSQVDEIRAALPPEADAMVLAALDTLEQHAIWADADWPWIRAATYAEARGAQHAADTYPAIRHALALLGETHGGLREAHRRARPESSRLDPTASPTPPDPVVKALPNGWGLVALPPFPDPNGGGAAAYAQRVHDRIAEVDREPRCGWVLDLRQDAGENLFAQLAAAGPLLGEGRAGYVVDPRRSADGAPTDSAAARAVLGYESGRAVAAGFDHASVAMPTRLPQRYPNVAVLIGPQTKAAGEALAVAFKNRPKARLFGAPTAGAATLLAYAELPDGSWLAYSSLALADRTGTLHVPRVLPDVEAAAGKGEIPRAARRWLRSRPECH